MVSQVLESVCDSLPSPMEVISTENMVAKIRELNLDITRLNEKNGEKCELLMLGADAVALFPNLMGVRTGEIVRLHVEESTMILEGISEKEMARYILNNKEKTGDLDPIRTCYHGEPRKEGALLG